MENQDLAPYCVRRATRRPGLEGKWDGPAWAHADTLTVRHFHPNSSDHRPLVQVRMVYDSEGVYGIFRVEDQYVLCTHTEYLGHVYEDACVEFFVHPKPDRGYFNFEMNCGGALLLFYIEDPTRLNDPARPDEEFVRSTPVPKPLGSRVRIGHSLPRVVAPEIETPVVWTLEFHIPFSLFETFVGPLGDAAGQEWRANFNKCADACSHPHWGTWAPLGEELNFHQPHRFGPIRFCP